MVATSTGERNTEAPETNISIPASVPFEDFIDGLGEPFRSRAKALLAVEAASRRMLAAGTIGDPNAKAKAELEHADALGEVIAIQHHEVQRLLYALRAAVADNPGTLLLLLDELFAKSEVIVKQNRDIAELAFAVAKLEARLSGRSAA